MNYKQRDDELIRRKKERIAKDPSIGMNKDLENRSYTGKGLDALAKGEYKTLRNNSTNKVPELKPSTKYQNESLTQSASARTSRKSYGALPTDVLKDFYDYRMGDFSGEVDYDPVTDTDVETWRNKEKQIKKQYKLSDKDFKSIWNEYLDDYYKDQTQANINAARNQSNFVNTLSQFMQTPGEWLEGGINTVGDIAGLLAGTVSPKAKEKLLPDEYNDTQFNNYLTKAGTKQAVRDNLKTGFGKTAYEIGTGLADMGLAMGLGKAAPVVMALPVVSRTQSQALQRGTTAERAAATGLASGVASVISNKLGLDKMFGAKGATILGTLAKAGNAEGLENVFEGAAHKLIDQAINKDKSERSQMIEYYKGQGMTEEEAKKQVNRETFGETISDYGSGLLLGGASKYGEMKLPSLFGNPDIPNIPNDPNVPAVTGDAVIDNAIKQTADAEAEIQRLSEQIPKVPEVVNESAPTLTPEDQAALQAELANEGYDWSEGQNGQFTPEEINNLKAGMARNVDESVSKANESVPKNPSITSKPLEGAEREAAQSKFNDLSKKLTQKNREVAVQKEIANKAKGKTKTAENKKLKALQAEVKEIQNGESVENTLDRIANNDIPDYTEQLANMPYTEPQGDLSAYEVAEAERNAMIDKQPKSQAASSIPNNVTPPGNNPPKTSMSQRYETLKKSDLFTKSEANMKMLETGKKQGVFNKDIENRRQTQEEALNDYLNNKEEVTKRNLERQWDSGKDVDTSMLILNDVLNEGDQAKVNLTLLKQAEQSKGAARVLRANRDYVGTKEGTIQKAGEYLSDKADKVLSSRKTKNQFEAMAERIVNGDLSELSSKLNMDEANIDNIRKAVKAGAGQADIVKMIGMYQAVGKTGISPEALKKISDIYDEIQRSNLNPNSRRRAELETDAFKALAKDIGGKRTWKEQWDAWRYLAMLGNPKTHLRNVLGNTTHYMVTEVKDNIGAVLEGAVDKVSKNGIERTKSILTNADNKLVEMSAKDADDAAYAALNDSGNKYNVKDEISRARDSFNNKKLSKIDEFNSSMLDKEDYSALKRKYSKSLARYLKANGADESIFNATDEASKALLDKARAYAIDQAKQATFHEYSKLAETLTNASRNLANSERFRDRAGSYVLEGLFPFKKTPINILKQGGKYSPISLAKSMFTAFDAVKTGNKTASEAIEELAAGLTGTGIMALGGFLASKGLLTGSADENYDVDNAEKDQGSQNYALKIGDESYTLDWLAPMSLPLFVGVEAYKKMEKKNANLGLNEFLSAMTTLGEPVTEMSMLQGINDTLEDLSYSPTSAIGTLAASTGLGYLTQGVPTLAGQITRAIDNTRRSTYSDKTGAEKSVDKAITKVKNKLPFVSSSSEPYINASGEIEKNEGFFANKLGNGILPNLMDQMLSPGYYKKGNVTDVDKELNRLYESTGESPYLNVSRGKVQDTQLSKSDFTKYQTLYGQTNKKLYTDIINSSEYSQLDDAQRLKILESAKDMSKTIADHKVGGKPLEKSDQELYDIYTSEGADGLVKSLKEKANLNTINDKYGIEMKSDTYEKWSTDPEKVALGGPDAYGEYKQKVDVINQKYGSNYTVDDLIKYGEQGTEQRAQGSIDAKKYGFVNKDGDANIDSYENAVSIVGNNDASLRQYSDYKKQGFEKNKDRVPYLMNNTNFTNEQKGMIIAGTDPEKFRSNTAKEVYKIGGYEGVWDYYMLKNIADKDDSGGLNKQEKKELIALMESDAPYITSIPDNVYYYLGGLKRW